MTMPKGYVHKPRKRWEEKTPQEQELERQKILQIQKEYHVKRGMPIARAAELAEQQREAMKEGPPEGGWARKSVGWALVRIAIGVVMAIIGIAAMMSVMH